jgi:hypothetical protein
MTEGEKHHHKTTTWGVFEVERRVMAQTFRLRPGRAEEADNDERVRMMNVIEAWLVRRAKRTKTSFINATVGPVGNPSDAMLAIWVELVVPEDLYCVSAMFWEAVTGQGRGGPILVPLNLTDLLEMGMDRAEANVGGETMTVGTTERRTH